MAIIDAMRARIAAVLFLALLAAVGLTGTAQAQGALKPGTMVERSLTLDGKALRLPDGQWVVGADGDSGWNEAQFGAYGYLRSVILYRLAGNRIDAVMEVNTNALPATEGWGMAASCARNDLLLAVVRYRAGWDGSCYFVTHSLLNKDENPVWVRARSFAEQSGWTLPAVLVTAGFRSANRADVLDVRLHFAPETRGLPSESVRRWKESGWMAARLDENAQRSAFAVSVSDWALTYASVVDASLKGRADALGAVPMPEPAQRAPVDSPLSRHMAELEQMHKAGLIPEAEYKAQMEALKERGLGTSSTAPDQSVITAVKAFSYRVIVSVSHIFVDYYWTGSYVATGALEVLQITINSAKFYMHELGWAKYMGVPRTDAARTIDFRYIGSNV